MTAVSTVMDSTVSEYPDAGAGADADADAVGQRALTPRVGPVDGMRQTFSLAWRTLVQIRHNPLELIDFSVQPVMFLLLFTYVFGGALGGSPKAYLLFALPGIIVQNSLFTTLNTATGLSTDLGFFDRLRSLPIARFAPLSGRILADLAKQTWAVAMLLGVGYILGFRIGTNPLGVLAATGLVLVSTLAISWALVLVSMLAANPEKVQIFGFVVLFPITFTSDAFVRTASMPGWLQAWSKANPVSLISDAVRGLMVSGPAGRPVVESLLYAVAFTVVFAPLAVRAFKRRV
jgi:oleandomycin transport system permease protein